MGFSKSNKIVADDVVTQAHNMTLRQSLLPCLLVTSLFFLWGFAYGLLDVLNSHFQALLSIDSSRASGLAASYFGAYFLCPLTISGWILRRYGFRITFITGLLVLCVGCLLFWPSGVKASFGGFCGSMFIVGAGLSTLETAADPFLAICGPPRYSEIRLNLAQACQGVGSLAAPLLASYVFFKNLDDTSSSLQAVQWVYLGVAIFVAILAVIFWFVPMPEVTDADMGLMESEIGDVDPGPFSKQYNLFLGVTSQFFYVGAQVALAGNFIPFCEEAGLSSEYSTKLLSAAQGIYAGMRFVSGFIMISPKVKPRYIMLAYLGMCFILAIVAMNTLGSASIAIAMLIFAFESACFATIFTTALRGLGRHTKRGGSFLVAAISGGAAFPAIMGVVIVKKDVHFSMIVPAMGYLIALIFPIYVNFFNAARIDLHRETDHAIATPSEKQVELGKQITAEDLEII